MTTGGSTLISLRARKCEDVVPDGDVCWDEDACGEKYDCWEHGAEIAQTGLIFRTSTGEILGGLVELNASREALSTTDGPACTASPVGPGCVGYDVQRLVTRSIGEALGFARVARTDSTMAISTWGDTSGRVVDPGTLEGLCALYSKGQPTPGCALAPPDVTPGTPSTDPPPPETPATDTHKGCDTSASGPLLGASVLLLRMLRRPRTGAAPSP